jgi:hypothetical protein
MKTQGLFICEFQMMSWMSGQSRTLKRCSGKEFAKWKINCRYYSPRSHCMTVIMRHASCALVTMAVVSLVIVAIVNNRTLKKR